MTKKALTIVIALAVLIIILLVLLFAVPRRAPLTTRPTQETGNAVEELTEGTRGADIESDLNLLLQEKQFLGDIEAQLQQMEQELQTEGL